MGMNRSTIQVGKVLNSVFHFIGINRTIQKKSENDGYAPLAGSEARITEHHPSGPHQQHSGANGVGDDGRTATGARCRITI
jgi:hypothetical protein